MKATPLSRSFGKKVTLFFLVVLGLSWSLSDAQSTENVASAFPADTWIFANIREPTEQLTALSESPIFPHVIRFLEPFGAEECDAVAPVKLMAHGLALWQRSPEFRELGQALAGEELILVVLPTLSGPVPMVAVRGADVQEAILALDEMVSVLFRAHVVPSESGNFQIVDEAGSLHALGRVAGDWVLISPQTGAANLESLAYGLVGESPFESSLSDMDSFENAINALPEDVPMKGFINTAQIADDMELLESRFPWALARVFLEGLDGIGMARRITPSCVETWLAWPAMDESTPVGQMIGAARLADGSLEARLPRRAWISYEAGTDWQPFLSAWTAILDDVAPNLMQLVTQRLDAFQQATGLHPRSDFIPALGNQIAAGLLGNGIPQHSVKLPHPLIYITVKDETQLRHFVDAWLDWAAGSVAEASGGLVSAYVRSDTHEGISIRGLQIDSLMSVMLPGPSYAIVDGILVISPFHGAVIEGIDAILGRSSQLGRMSWACADPGPVSAIERFRMSLVETTDADRGKRPVNAQAVDEKDQMLDAVLAFLRALKRVNGVTYENDQARLVSYIEVRLD